MRQHEGELVGDRVGIDRHRHGAEHLHRHHRPIELRPVGADDGDGFAALEAEPVQADGIGAHDLEHLRPRSRSAKCRDPCAALPAATPNNCALRINSFGNVSAAAAASGRHSLILPLSRAVPLTAPHPSAAFRAVLLSRYENTGAGRSSLCEHGKRSQAEG